MTFYPNIKKMRNILGTSMARMDEQFVFARALSNIGPYVALGRPTENCQNMDLLKSAEYSDKGSSSC